MSIFDWSLTASSNGNADATINFQEGQAPSTVNDSARALMARMAFFRNWSAGNMTQGGASNAYTITSGESLTAYTNGMRFLWKPNGNSSGAVTLNVDSIGAKKVYLPSGTQAGSGNIDADAVYDVVYQSALDSANGGFKIVGADAGALSVSLLALSGVTPAADALPYFTSTSVAAVTTFTSFARTLLDDANQAAAQVTIGYIAADVLTKLFTVDGAGSGLDADLLDGLHASSFYQIGGTDVAISDGGTGSSTQGGAFTNIVAPGGTVTGEIILPTTGPTGATSVGFRGAPFNTQTGNYTFVLADAGRAVKHADAANHTFTVPPNSSVAFPIGTTIVVINGVDGGTLSVAQGSGVTIFRGDGSGAASGTRTMGVGAIATLIKEGTDSWFIGGAYT